MTGPNPTCTVVVPLYNTERYIAETLDSVLAQTFCDFEVVVVNDASSDHGPAIVEQYMARDSRIRMVTQANRGLAGARNTGIREARGTYIAFLDADDVWLPEKLERELAHLEACPDVGLSYAPSLFIDEWSERIGLAQHPQLTGSDAEHLVGRNPVGNGSAPVMRRAALDDVMFEIDAPEGRRQCWFDESFRQSEDIELWTRLAATTAWRVEGIAPPLTLYRVNNTGLSANIEKQLATWRRFRDKMATIAPQLVARAGARSESYQFRYLARRAAMSGQGFMSLRLSLRSIAIYPRILFEDPRRTLVTVAFAAAACIVPADFMMGIITGSLNGIARVKQSLTGGRAPAGAGQG